MKRLTTKEKQLLIIKAKKKWLHERRRSAIRKQIKLKKQLQESFGKKLKREVNQLSKVIPTRLEAPKNFSLINNYIEVIAFFKNACVELNKSKSVYFDLGQVTELTVETIAYFCAFINDRKIIEHSLVTGNTPKSRELREMIVQSGFYDHVHSRLDLNGDTGDKTGKLIHRFSRKKVEPELAGEIVSSALHHTFNNPEIKKQSFYEILIECMANTKNHASGIENDEIYNWWLIAYKEHSTKITKFCFVDMGIGIFDSLHFKHKQNKLSKVLSKILSKNDNVETLRQIFHGERKSSLRQPERGQGINHIYNLVKEDKHIGNFTMISNGVQAKIGYNMHDQISDLNIEFDGTLYYWELKPTHD